LFSFGRATTKHLCSSGWVPIFLMSLLQFLAKKYGRTR
jgi:hypothetical protein